MEQHSNGLSFYAGCAINYIVTFLRYNFSAVILRENHKSKTVIFCQK